MQMKALKMEIHENLFDYLGSSTQMKALKMEIHEILFDCLGCGSGHIR